MLVACASARPQPWKSQALIAIACCFESSARATRSAACRYHGPCLVICVSLWLIHRNPRWVAQTASAPDRSARMRYGVHSVSVFAPQASHDRSAHMHCGIVMRRDFWKTASILAWCRSARPHQHSDDRHLHALDRADPGLAQEHSRQDDERPVTAGAGRARGRGLRRFADDYLTV